MTDQPTTQPEAPCDLLTGCHFGLGHKGRCEPAPAEQIGVKGMAWDAVTDDASEPGTIDGHHPHSYRTMGEWEVDPCKTCGLAHDHDVHAHMPAAAAPIRTEQEARITRNARTLLVAQLDEAAATTNRDADPDLAAAHRAHLRAQIMDLDLELEDYYDRLAPEADDDTLAADDTPQTPTTPATAADEADNESGDVVDAEVIEDTVAPSTDDRGIPGVTRPRALPATLTDGLTVWTDQCSAQVRQTVYPLLDTNDEPLHNDDGTPASIGGEGALFLALDAAPRADEAGNPYRLDAGTARDLRDLLNVATARGLL